MPCWPRRRSWASANNCASSDQIAVTGDLSEPTANNAAARRGARRNHRPSHHGTLCCRSQGQKCERELLTSNPTHCKAVPMGDVKLTEPTSQTRLPLSAAKVFSGRPRSSFPHRRARKPRLQEGMQQVRMTMARQPPRSSIRSPDRDEDRFVSHLLGFCCPPQRIRSPRTKPHSAGQSCKTAQPFSSVLFREPISTFAAGHPILPHGRRDSNDIST